MEGFMRGIFAVMMLLLLAACDLGAPESMDRVEVTRVVIVQVEVTRLRYHKNQPASPTPTRAGSNTHRRAATDGRALDPQPALFTSLLGGVHAAPDDDCRHGSPASCQTRYA